MMGQHGDVVMVNGISVYTVVVGHDNVASYVFHVMVGTAAELSTWTARAERHGWVVHEVLATPQ
jgi:hypothetical protein